MANLMRDKILCIRLDKLQDKYVDKAVEILADSRGVGAKKVTKTEAVLVLLSMGMETFNAKYGNPIKKK